MLFIIFLDKILLYSEVRNQLIMLEIFDIQ
jgi:hypothetical protein